MADLGFRFITIHTNRVGQRVYDGVDRMTAEDLLTHLQAEPELFPELQGLACWADLAINKISNDLLDRITQKGITGDFKGTCPRCPHGKEEKKKR